MLNFFKKKKKKEIIVDIPPMPLTAPNREITITMNNNPNVIIGCAYAIGKRNYQQDAVKIPSQDTDDQRVIAILSDGMGGMDSGDIASNMCTKYIFEDFYNEKDIESYPDFLKKEIVKLDKEVFALTDANGNHLQSGATLLCCIIDDTKAYWASVGDSHIYIIRDNKIIRVNKEHNYSLQLAEQVKKGLITQEQADKDPKKDALISYIGMGGIHLADITESPFELQSEDKIVLCSDGLYRTLSDEAIKEIINIYDGNIQNACEELIKSVIDKDKPCQDNTSVIVIKYL